MAFKKLTPEQRKKLPPSGFGKGKKKPPFNPDEQQQDDNFFPPKGKGRPVPGGGSPFMANKKFTARR